MLALVLALVTGCHIIAAYESTPRDGSAPGIDSRPDALPFDVGSDLDTGTLDSGPAPDLSSQTGGDQGVTALAGVPRCGEVPDDPTLMLLELNSVESRVLVDRTGDHPGEFVALDDSMALPQSAAGPPGCSTAVECSRDRFIQVDDSPAWDLEIILYGVSGAALAGGLIALLWPGAAPASSLAFDGRRLLLRGSF